MSRKSATQTIKKLNPKNISGSVPKALDMLTELKKIKDNPTIIKALGAANIMSTLKHIQALFKTAKKKNESQTQGEAEEEQRISTMQESIDKEQAAETQPPSTNLLTDTI